MKIILAFTIVFFAMTFSSHAQQISNFSYKIDIENVTFSYDLNADKSQDLFNIEIFISKNNGESYSLISKDIVGDILKVSKGKNKKIVWNYKRANQMQFDENCLFKLNSFKNTDIQLVNPIEMVFLKGGTFNMGSPIEEKGRKIDELQHPVILKEFYISTTEVTQALWTEIMGANPSFNIGNNFPVENVTWDDVQIFISKLNQKTGRKYRLPTESEWEFACRANSILNYNTGEKLLVSQANFDYTTLSNGPSICACHKDKCADHKTEEVLPVKTPVCVSIGKTLPVASFSPNAWGIYDMHGNVIEWCSDWYGSYLGNIETNPVGRSTGKYKVARGGAWNSSFIVCRSASRFYYLSANKSKIMGFRLVLD